MEVKMVNKIIQIHLSEDEAKELVTRVEAFNKYFNTLVETKRDQLQLDFDNEVYRTGLRKVNQIMRLNFDMCTVLNSDVWCKLISELQSLTSYISEDIPF